MTIHTLKTSATPAATRPGGAKSGPTPPPPVGMGPHPNQESERIAVLMKYCPRCGYRTLSRRTLAEHEAAEHPEAGTGTRCETIGDTDTELVDAKVANIWESAPRQQLYATAATVIEIMLDTLEDAGITADDALFTDVDQLIIELRYRSTTSLTGAPS